MADRKKPNGVWRVIKWSLLLAALGGAIYLHVVVLFTAQIISGSMEPTLLVGDRVLVNRLAYKRQLPKPGDVIALNTLGREEVWIKRVVAVPGDVVWIRAGKLYRNGRPVSEPYIRTDPRLFYPPVTLPPGRVWVLGDNRVNSDDSRDWGSLKQELIVGKVFHLVWPRNRMRPIR